MSERIQHEIAEGLREVENSLSSILTIPQLPALSATVFRQIPVPTLSLSITLPKPVTVDSSGIKFNINTIERDRFYEVEYEGTKYIVRLTRDGVLENYEVE